MHLHKHAMSNEVDEIYFGRKIPPPPSLNCVLRVVTLTVPTLDPPEQSLGRVLFYSLGSWWFQTEVLDTMSVL